MQHKTLRSSLKAVSTKYTWYICKTNPKAIEAIVVTAAFFNGNVATKRASSAVATVSLLHNGHKVSRKISLLTLYRTQVQSNVFHLAVVTKCKSAMTAA